MSLTSINICNPAEGGCPLEGKDHATVTVYYISGNTLKNFVLAGNNSPAPGECKPSQNNIPVGVPFFATIIRGGQGLVRSNFAITSQSVPNVVMLMGSASSCGVTVSPAVTSLPSLGMIPILNQLMTGLATRLGGARCCPQVKVLKPIVIRL